ncbi:host attachment protein [Methylobacterium nonmethylotrophicum]|uniref:host attachment protein n=1 Tax=Methylobacterium nonmethylotrophicum TaxID=1141884 RepID=UPI001FE10BA6|nr:host attachment protein [Methylobacterium nonmethylotrophicum]
MVRSSRRSKLRPTRRAASSVPTGRPVSGVDERRSAIAQTDRHELAEQRFAAEVAAGLNRVAGPVSALVVVAPPRILAALHLDLSEGLRRVLMAEIDQDLTKTAVSEMQRHLCGR